MKCFRRLLLLLISAALLLNVGGTFAETDGNAEPKHSHIGKLQALGLWASDVSADAVTRGDFARLMTAMLGMDELQIKTVADESRFSDLDKENKAYAAVYFLSEKGVLSGDGDRFYPERPITYDEAVKMLVCALGYETAARENGGYPAGYRISARRFQLIRGSEHSGTAQLTAELCAEMINDAMNAKLMEPSYGSEKAWSVKDTTVLQEYHKIGMVRGVLEASGGSSLSAKDTYPDDILLIGDDKFQGDAKQFEKYVGYRMEAYYKLEDDKGERALIYMEPAAGANKIFEVSEEKILGCENGCLLYEGEGGKTLRKQICSDKTRAQFNGVYAEITDEDIKNADRIIWIDNGTGNMPVVKIDSFQVYVADSLDHTENILTVRFPKGEERTVELGENNGEQTVALTDHLGVPADFYAVKKNSVLRVGKSKDGKKVSIILTGVQKEGVLDGFNIDEKKLMLDGVEYSVAPKSAAAEQLREAEAGKRYSLYLDDRFRAAAIERQDAGEEKYGYMTGAVCDSAFESMARFRIFTQNNRFEEFESAARVKVDGDVLKNGAAIVGALQNEQGVIERQPVRYRVNDEGKLIYLDTARRGTKEQSNGTFRGNHTMTRYDAFMGGRFIGDPPMFGAESYNPNDNMQYNVKMTAKTPVFCVPPLNASEEQIGNEDNYCVTNIRIFKNYSTYKENAATGERVDAYDLDENWTAGMLLYYTRKTTAEPITDKTPITVVQEIIKGLDSEGNPQSYLYGFQAGNYVSVPISDGLEDMTKEYYAENGTVSSTVRFGDAIRFSLDSKGRIDDYEKVFSLTDEDNPEYVKWGNEVDSVNTVQKNPSLVSWSEGYTDHGYCTPFVYKAKEAFEAEYRVAFGTMKERVGNNIVLRVDGEKPMTIVGDIQRYNVLVVDEARHEMYMPDLNEFLPESVVGPENASQVLLHTSKGSSRTVVLVKRAEKK